MLQSKVIDGRAVLAFTLPPAGDDPAADRHVRRVLHVVGPLAGCDRTVRHQPRPTVHGRSRPVRRAARARRDGKAILGFRNLEPRGQDGLAIGDPIPVGLDDEGYLVAL